jgi:hypothetical protein
MSPVKHRFLLEVVGWCAKVAILVKLEKEKKMWLYGVITVSGLVTYRLVMRFLQNLKFVKH